MSLFSILKDLFATEETPQEAQHPQLSRVVLLLEAAIYDADFAAVERQTIETILSTHYDMTAAEAHELIELAAEHRERFPDIHAFTRELARLPIEQRRVLMEEIWQVIYADEKIEATEELYARKMQKLLRLDHSEWIAAKQRVAMSTENEKDKQQ